MIQTIRGASCKASPLQGCKQGHGKAQRGLGQQLLEGCCAQPDRQQQECTPHGYVLPAPGGNICGLEADSDLLFKIPSALVDMLLLFLSTESPAVLDFASLRSCYETILATQVTFQITLVQHVLSSYWTVKQDFNFFAFQMLSST